MKVTQFALYPAMAFTISLVFTFIAMPILLRFCKKRGLYDIPNERKVHKNNIPRLGGAVFMPATIIGAACAFLPMTIMNIEGVKLKMSTLIIFSGMFLIYLIGLLDDLFGLRATFKFIVQFIAALIMPLCGLYINNLYGFCGIEEVPMWIGYPLTIFISLLVVNAINLIDGIDGLASGLSIVTLTCFFVLFCRIGVLSYIIFLAALIGSVLAFMYFNLFGKESRSTKTFMGDTGSLILGYAIAFFAIKSIMVKPEVLPYRPEALMVAYSLVLIPVFDLIRVALKRISRGVSIFHPDKTHLHHRLLAAGLSMHGALAVILTAQVVFCILNAVLFRCAGLSITWIVVIDLLLSEAFYAVINHTKRQRSEA